MKGDGSEGSVFSQWPATGDKMRRTSPIAARSHIDGNGEK